MIYLKNQLLNLDLFLINYLFKKKYIYVIFNLNIKLLYYYYILLN